MLSSVPQPLNHVNGAHHSAGERTATGRHSPSLAGVVLLGGSVRASQFHDAIGRWALDLPCAAANGTGDALTLVRAWVDAVGALSAAWNYPIPLRILADQTADAAAPAGVSSRSKEAANGAVAAAGAPLLTIDKDPLELRGTGGVLRDISGSYPPESFILVANAAQVLLRPLPALAESLNALHADIAVLAHADGTPTTLMLVRCGALSALPAAGFLDMKEQALPLLLAKYPVHVVTMPVPVALGVRTAKSYIAALRSYHLVHNGGAAGAHQDAWRSAFQIVEPGATVDPSARLHDSVVLKNAKVGKGAIVVRSVVCPGAVVGANQTVVDKLVLTSGEQHSTEEAS